jgi:hypothetical protein
VLRQTRSVFPVLLSSIMFGLLKDNKKFIALALLVPDGRARDPAGVKI